MNRQEICERLCSYDLRNPASKDLLESLESIGVGPAMPGAEHCGCDNCFYGRHRLAVELLNHMDSKAVPPLFDWVIQRKDREIIINPGHRKGWVELQMIQGTSVIAIGMDTTKPQRFEEAAVKETEAITAASLEVH